MLVQTSPQWWDNARSLRYVDSQEELDKYAGELDRWSNLRTFDYYYSNRKWLQMMRIGIYNALFRWHFGFRGAFSPMRPGLEIKFACESAEKVGAKLSFLGPELDQDTWQRMMHETRFNVPDYLIKRFQYRESRWTDETLSNR